MLRAVIKPEWAEAIGEVDVWRFNTASAESLLTEVNVRTLGGLEVPLATPRIADSELIKNARSVRHIVNLAFGEPAVETHTGLLLRAAHDTYGVDDERTRQLAQRNIPNGEHGSDEPWFFPLSGVTIIEHVIVPEEVEQVAVL